MALYNEVNRYFMDKTKKVYIERCNGIETFEQYLDYRYRDCSFNYSVYALMGLNCDDYLVRGETRFYSQHSWVEFKFDGEEYVFDPRSAGIVSKLRWYQENKPRFEKKCTQQEILAQHLTEENAIEVKDGFWQFKDITCDEKSDVLYLLRLSRIQINTRKNEESNVIDEILRIDLKQKVTRFIAYDEPVK